MDDFGLAEVAAIEAILGKKFSEEQSPRSGI